MRVLGLVVLCAATASAQTHVEGTGTVGIGLESSGENTANSALDVFLERSFESALAVSAHLVAQVLAAPTGALAFQDLSSWVRIQVRLPSWDTEAAYLEVFPFDGRRVRSTFDFANFWGQPVRAKSFAPTVKVGFVRNNVSIWVAGRGYQQTDNRTLEPALRMTGLLGGGVQLPYGFRSDVILTVSERGDVPVLAMRGSGDSVLAYGGSAQLVWESGGGVLEAAPTALASTDPNRFARIFARQSYQTPLAAHVGLEGGIASQNLLEPGGFFVTRRDLTGYADFQARLRLKSLRVSATFRFHQAAFINFDGPGLIPFEAFPKDAITQDEYSGLLAIDYRFAGLGLTPGLLLGVLRPASLKPFSALVVGGNNPPSALGARVFVLPRSGVIQALPAGTQAMPQYQASASLLFDRFELLSALLVVRYDFDPNNTRFIDDVAGTAEPKLVPVNTVRVDLLVQCRF